jgi:putative FmdB family regulatory protein
MMISYDFVCNDCKTAFSKEMKISEYKIPDKCPLCGGNNCERSWKAPPAVIWNTSGAFGKFKSQ